MQTNKENFESLSSVQVIAEIGNAHEGSLGLAKCLIKAAAECGVDAVKFQTHIFEAESLPDAPNPPYFKDETRKAYFERTAFTEDEWKKLRRYAEDECNVGFLSSPFSLEAVNLLEKIGIKSYKIASGEVTNFPLLKRIAETGKPTILSSGMSSWNELDEAVEVLRANGCKDLLVLQCTSEYPCPPEEAGLNVLEEIKKRYNVPVGYSDHTEGIAVSLGAVAMGAVLIEKHFTLSKQMYGSDAPLATEPSEFTQLVSEIRALEKALNNQIDKDKKVTQLSGMKETFQKSIVAAKPLKKGQKLTLADLAFKKPDRGIGANQVDSVVGKTISKDLERNDYVCESGLTS